MVPQEKRIPGFGSDVFSVITEKPSVSNRFFIDREIVDTADPIDVGIDFQIIEEIQGIAIDDNRFVILDKISPFLYEYDSKENTLDTLASVGSGPGELSFPKDLSFAGDRLFVYLGIGSVMLFDCLENPCKYVSTESLTPHLNSADYDLRGNSHVVSATMNFTFDNSGRPDNINDSHLALAWVEESGEIKRQAGSVYDIGEDWMLADRFINRGTVRTKDGFTIFVNERLPVIGLLNSRFEETLYRIDDFQVGLQRYDTSTGRVTAISADHSRIKLLPAGYNDILVVEIATYRNREVVDFSYKWDIQTRYYTIESPYPALALVGSFVEGAFMLARAESGILWSKNGSTYFSKR